MEKRYKEELILLHQSAWFQQLIIDILLDIPEIPAHNPKQDNTLDWQYKSAYHEGCHFILRKLGVEPDARRTKQGPAKKRS